MHLFTIMLLKIYNISIEIITKENSTCNKENLFKFIILLCFISDF